MNAQQIKSSIKKIEKEFSKLKLYQIDSEKEHEILIAKEDYDPFDHDYSKDQELRYLKHALDSLKNSIKELKKSLIEKE